MAPFRRGDLKLVFSSISFIGFFLPVTLLIYHICPVRARNGLLALVSLFFYAWGEPKYVLIMIFSTVFDYINGLGIERMQQKGKTGRGFLILSIVGNLAILGFFKYTDFAISSVNKLASLSLPLAGIALPIGISFYTFQTMSYSIDVYRGDTKAQHNIIDFAAYVTMFPQLIAGPIVRYRTIADELEANKKGGRRSLRSENFGLGMQRFILGLGKKVLLANQAGALWTEISALDHPSTALAWTGAVCYTFQIYFDFSGYSDMAIGLGRMLGFTFPENFNYPYTCSSITDFWRRWHMTLGSWFREYVYIPLGGNQRGMAVQLRNIFIVWMLTGLWHGAAWTFVCWGLYYGLILMLEKLFLLRWLDKLPGWLHHVYTLPVIVIGWVIFASDDFNMTGKLLSAMFGLNGAPLFDAQTGFYLRTCGCMLIIMAASCTRVPRAIGSYMIRVAAVPGPDEGPHEGPCDIASMTAPPETAPAYEKLCDILKNIYLLAVFGLSLVFLVSSSYNPFLYFRF